LATPTPLAIAFQRAIAEAPRDDLPRLIYADWLEEHDQEDRAEFIRLGIELAGDITVREKDKKERRRKDLLAGRDDSWLWPIGHLLGDAKPPAWWKFERGFVCSLTLPARLFPENAGAIFAQHPILNVELTVGMTYGQSLSLGYDYYGRSLRPEGGDDVVVLFNRAMTRAGSRQTTIPGEMFSFLTKTGFPVEIHGAAAELPEGADAGEIVSRAAVQFGRHEAGLPPFTWE
jgi:uncharacterized protein (TIGR02996 family)